VRRIAVTERRRLCTTSCIFGSSVLRTVFTKFCRVVDVLGGQTGVWLLLESEEVVMNSDGRISWNVESCLQGGFLGGGIDDESDGGAQYGVTKLNCIENGERTR
jgi:hypothetical protein